MTHFHRFAANVLLFLIVALAIVGCLAILTAFASPPPRATLLPPIPKTIASVLGPVAVHVVYPLLCNGKPALGCYDPDERYLAIQDSMPLVVSWRVLRHERAHMVFADNSVLFPNVAVEDRFAEILANADVLEMLAAAHSP